MSIAGAHLGWTLVVLTVCTAAAAGTLRSLVPLGFIPLFALLYYYLVNCRRDETSSSEPNQPGAEVRASYDGRSAPDTRSTTERLRELEKLRSDRLIDDEEYFRIRRQLVEGL